METSEDRVHYLASQSDGASNRGKMSWTNGLWVEGIKALLNSAINESASASLLTPCLLTPYPQGPSRGAED